jgi:hypothetical protein
MFRRGSVHSTIITTSQYCWSIPTNKNRCYNLAR